MIEENRVGADQKTYQAKNSFLKEKGVKNERSNH